MAYQTPLTIAEVMKDIASNKYVLPSIQREYVWDTTQIEALFDSLMQDYPIGTFLFWEIGRDKINEYDFYEFLKDYHEKDSTHNPKVNLNGSDGVTAVLDGQQRLTSLYVGLKGTYAYKLKWKQKNSINAYPVRKLYLNLLSEATEGDNKYDFRFLTDDEAVSTEKAYWFPVGEILNMSDLGSVNKYINKNIYKSKFSYSDEQDDFAMDSLSLLYKVIHMEHTINYYSEKSTELDKVLNIFIRVNSGGTVLTYSDLLLSIATAQWDNHDAREEITKFVDDVNAIGDGFKINKDFVLKSALVLTDSITDITFKGDNFKKANMMKIEENWDNIKKAIEQTVRLVSAFGYSGETLSSNNAMIPIAYYLLKIGMPDNFVSSSSTKTNRAKIKKWLIMTLLKKTFSGQPDNVLRPIREIIQKNDNNDFPIEKIIDRFKGSNKSIMFNDYEIDEYLLKLRYGKNETLSTLMLLYPSLNFNNKFHMDHIYPKSRFTKKSLRENGVPEEMLDKYIEMVNDIGNLQLLPALLNEEKLDTDFDVWFANEYQTENDKIQQRSIHYLPDIEYTYENFLEFIKNRKKLIKAELVKILL